jgi:hypothetical protein
MDFTGSLEHFYEAILIGHSQRHQFILPCKTVGQKKRVLLLSLFQMFGLGGFC